ncbi:MAG: 3-deoxy-7-phosphoheptulonate synthase [Planctomycetes bacterium]|nr:3-deoxy-7-phosphoheptulonate synthase [Planctomycetota bacterium]
MIIILKPEATDAQVEHVLDRIHSLGFETMVSRGVQRTIVGVIGEEDRLREMPLDAIPGVERVMQVLKPYKRASREFREADTVIDVKGTKFGGGSFGMIAGPCAVESEEMIFQIAERVKKAGVNVLRGGAFKPRTSPYSFQGLKEDGLKMLRAAADEFDMAVCTEVMDTRDVDLVARYADIVQIGARNMQNYNLLSEVGLLRKPVLLKRGLSAMVKELLTSAEYILSAGNEQVILCERGVRTFEDSTRNTLDISAIPNVQINSHLPIIVDPSHAVGRWDLVWPMAIASLAVGADGLMVEVHPSPEAALSDGAQSLLPDRFEALTVRMGELAEHFDKVIT